MAQASFVKVALTHPPKFEVKTIDEVELETTINIQKRGYEFLDKPVIVGGLAME